MFRKQERPQGPREPSRLVTGARRRRASFDSFDAALQNFASKPPMMNFDPDVLRMYVAHGFAPSPEGVRLKCDPEHEARTFENGGLHRTWDLLPEIATRVVVVTGVLDGQGPAAIAEGIADRLPNSTFLSRPESSLRHSSTDASRPHRQSATPPDPKSCGSSRPRSLPRHFEEVGVDVGGDVG